jgi:hypothetical protein
MKPSRIILVSTLFLALGISFASSGCKKDGDGSGAAANLPVKGPWDAVKVTFDKKGADGPQFKIENTGAKTVKVLFLDFYAYDAKGNQVGKKELSYNIEVKGGKSTETSVSDVKDAVTWDATYHGIELEGDKLLTDYKRAPDKKPKGK